MTVLEKLIIEQAKDDKKRRISKNKRENNFSSQTLSRIRATWGEPAQIVSCRIDRTCARCNSRKPTYESTQLIAGISFLKDNKQIVGACCDCGFSF